jgi:hypothetical protein
MTAAADFLDLLETPAFKAVHRLLMERGTWVARSEFDALGHLPVPLENALADVVMLGQAVYQRAAGYRLAQAPVVRQAARELMAHPEEQRWLQMLQVADGVHVGVAVRQAGGDVLMAGLVVPQPEGCDGLQWVPEMAHQVMNSMEVGHGR